jgi:hypothetical protein
MRRLRLLCGAAALGVASMVTGATGPGPYDPAVDASEQLRAAGRRAQGTNRRVLAMVGGNW